MTGRYHLTTNKTKQNACSCCGGVKDRSYLLQLLLPSLLANHPTVENHWGGAQTERHLLSHWALHKRLQVRVQLQKIEHICQSRQSRWGSTLKPIRPAQWRRYEQWAFSPPTLWVTLLMSSMMNDLVRHTASLMRMVLLQRPHFCFLPCWDSLQPLRPADRQLQGATAGEDALTQHCEWEH